MCATLSTMYVQHICQRGTHATYVTTCTTYGLCACVRGVRMSHTCVTPVKNGLDEIRSRRSPHLPKKKEFLQLRQDKVFRIGETNLSSRPLQLKQSPCKSLCLIAF